MLNLRESDINSIKENIGEDSVLLSTDDIELFLVTLYDWIDINGFGTTERTYMDYNDLGRAAQKVYDYVYAYG